MDETGAIARAAGARVLRQRTLGYAGALAEGYVELRRWGIERVVQLDADGQHPAGRARTLLAGLREADLVIGCRDDGAGGTAGAMHRALGRQLLSSLIRRTCGVATRDPTSGFWALGPRALEAFSAWFPADVADANVRVWADRWGLRIAEVPVAMATRQGGRSMHAGLRGGINLVRSVRAVLREARRPLPELLGRGEA
jgi:hypothetical protein